MKHVLLMSLIMLAIASVAASAAPVSKVVNIRYDSNVPTLEFACSELSAALKAAKLEPVVTTSDKKAPVSSGWTVVAGLQSKLKTADAALGKLKPLEEDGFTIQPRPKEQLIYVVGADPRGAMYGVLELTEHIELGGTLSSVTAKTEKPDVHIRSLKINMPGWDAQDMEGEAKEEWEWFLSEDYWRSFFRMMARNRYNICTIWHSHPYHWMVRIPKYPEATDLSDEQMERCQKAFTFMFAEAAKHGLDTYLITWNIHYPAGMIKKHNLEWCGSDTPVVRDYMREAIKAVLREYPGLTGIGTCPGEAMKGTARENEAWLMDTYVPALLEVRGPQKFIHRYWGSEPKPMQEVFAANYPGKTYLDLKFNGESMYSSPAPHFVDPVWLDQKPRDYEILWHLRNDDLYIFRWGDASFVRDTLKHCVGEGVAGYVTGSEFEWVGPDRLYSDYGKQYQTWKYDIDKHWMRYMVWGKLAYNLNLPESYFKKYFMARFGPEVGLPLYFTQTTASKIMPLVDCFHWNYMNFDWAGESCMNPNPTINTAREGTYQNPNYRESNEYYGNFNNIREWIFNWTIDDGDFIGIPEYVGNLLAGVKKGTDEAKRMTPLEVADKWDAYATEVERGLTKIKPVSGKPGYKEAVSWTWDLQLLASMARYYADKTRGGVDLLHYWCTGDKSSQERAVDGLRNAKGHWLEVVDLGEKVYQFPERYLYRDLRWSKYLKDVDQDIAFAENPPPFKSRTVGWSVIEPIGATDAELVAYEKAMFSRAPKPDIEFRAAPVETTEIDLTGEDRFRFWLEMTNRRSKFLNLRRVWPDKEAGVAYLDYEMPKSSKRWCVLHNDLGRVDKIWYAGKLIYNREEQGAEVLKKGFAFLVKPGENVLKLRCDGVKGQDWGCSLRPEFRDAYTLASEVDDAYTVTVTVKNSFPQETMAGFKLSAVPWASGWEVSPAEVTIDVKDEAEAKFVLKQTDPNSNWTGVSFTGDYSGESRPTSTFTPLPGLNTWLMPGFGDGQWRAEQIGGKWATVSQPELQSSFIYYNVRDEYLFDIDQDVNLSIEYYYDGNVDEINIDYDSHLEGIGEGAFCRTTMSIAGEKGWHKQTMKLPRAKLKNREQGVADMRLSGPDGKRIYIGAVDITK